MTDYEFVGDDMRASRTGTTSTAADVRIWFHNVDRLYAAAQFDAELDEIVLVDPDVVVLVDVAFDKHLRRDVQDNLRRRWARDGRYFRHCTPFFHQVMAMRRGFSRKSHPVYPPLQVPKTPSESVSVPSSLDLVNSSALLAGGVIKSSCSVHLDAHRVIKSSSRPQNGAP